MKPKSLFNQGFSNDTGKLDFHSVIESGVPRISAAEWVERALAVLPPPPEGDAEVVGKVKKPPSAGGATAGSELGAMSTARGQGERGSQTISLVMEWREGKVNRKEQYRSHAQEIYRTEPMRCRVNNPEDTSGLTRRGATYVTNKPPRCPLALDIFAFVKLKTPPDLLGGRSRAF